MRNRHPTARSSSQSWLGGNWPSMMEWGEEWYRDGLDKDGSWVRRKDEGAPAEDARCPGCVDMWTRWRGPLPPLGVPPVGKVYLGKIPYEAALVPYEDEPRGEAARRLYKLADTWKDKPQPMEKTPFVVYQAALCHECSQARMDAWFDSLWPAPKSKKARDRGDGDWDL